MATVRELITKWGFEVDDSELKKMEQTQKQLRVGFVKLGAAAAGVLAAVVLPAASLQAAIKDTLTLSEETGESFRKLEKGMTAAALNISNRLGFSAKEVAVGFYQVLSTGAEALSPQFNALSEIALKMAKTVGLEPAEAIERLNDTLNAFKLGGEEAGRVADVLFKGSILAATTVPQLTEAMRSAAPAAVAMGITLEETTAILDTLAQSGFKASEGGNAFKRIMLRIATDKQAAKVMKNLGVETTTAGGEFRNIIDIFKDLKKGMVSQTQAEAALTLKTIAGQFAFAQLGSILSGNLDTMGQWVRTLESSGGALDKAFKIKMSSATEQAKLFWIRLKNLAAVLGGPMLESLGDIIKGVSNFVQSIQELLAHDPELARLIATWGGLALVITIIGSAMGIAATSAKIFMITMAAGGVAVAATMFWMIALAAVLAVLVGVVISNREEFEEFWKINKDAPWAQIAVEFIGWISHIENATQAFKDLKDAVSSVKGAWDFLVGSLSKTRTGFAEMFGFKELPKQDDFLSRFRGAIGRGGTGMKDVFGAPTTPELSSVTPATGATITNNFGDFKVDINGTGLDPQKIVDEIDARFNGYMRNTAATLGQ